MLEVNIKKSGEDNNASFDMTGFKPAGMYQDMMLDGLLSLGRW